VCISIKGCQKNLSGVPDPALSRPFVPVGRRTHERVDARRAAGLGEGVAGALSFSRTVVMGAVPPPGARSVAGTPIMFKLFFRASLFFRRLTQIGEFSKLRFVSPVPRLPWMVALRKYPLNLVPKVPSF